MSAAVIESAPLLDAVAPELPCGDNLEYDPEFLELERAAQGKPEQQIGDTFVAAEDPDWREVERRAVALFARTKDLRVAAHLCRAATGTRGLKGLAEALDLVRDLLAQYWDTLHPQIEDDGDCTFRVNSLAALADRDGLLRQLRETPLLESRVAPVSLRDVFIAQGRAEPRGDEAPDPRLIDAAFQDVDEAALRDSADAAARAAAALAAIGATLGEHLGVGEAPDLDPLRELLGEVEREFARHLSARGLAPAGSAPATGDGAAHAGNGALPAEDAGGFAAAARPGTITGRQDVVRALDSICAWYDKAEPSSPVPLLLRRAKMLVEKDFLTLLAELAPAGREQFESMIRPGGEPPSGD